MLTISTQSIDDLAAFIQTYRKLQTDNACLQAKLKEQTQVFEAATVQLQQAEARS